jgi:hypothetical protein
VQVWIGRIRTNPFVNFPPSDKHFALSGGFKLKRLEFPMMYSKKRVIPIESNQWRIKDLDTIAGGWLTS